ncbi:hypothetical protein Q9189_002359 [Teloschistes chrysophthalmus]
MTGVIIRDEAPAAPQEAQEPGLPKVKASLLETEHPLLAVEKDFANAFSRHGDNVPFEVHCQLTAKLLKLHRSAATDQRKYTASVLATWIIRSCHRKMMKRLNTGITKRNVWKYLTEITEADLRAGRLNFEVVEAYNLSPKLPTCEQSDFLEKQRKAGRIITDWNERKPIFDKAGRRLIRNLMSRLLIEVRDSLGRLDGFLKSEEAIKVANLKDSDAAFQETLDLARVIINNVYRSLSTLNNFLETFEGQVLKTCHWIARIFELRSTSDAAPSSSPVKLHQPKPTAKEQSAEAEDAEGHPKDIDEEAAMDLDAVTEGTKYGWAKAAVKWMKHVCIHIKALKSLIILETKTDRNQLRLSKYIEKVVLKVVSVMPEARDIRMESYQDVLESFSLSPRSEKIKAWFLAQDTLMPFVFPGSHSVWTAVTLPPCLPQDFGKELIKSAKAKLRKRFEKIVLSLQTGQSNPRKRSISVATDVPGQAEE